MGPLKDKPKSYQEGYAAAVVEICDTITSDLHQGDLEYGVAWINEQACKDFANQYPYLNKALAWLQDLDTEAQEWLEEHTDE